MAHYDHNGNWSVEPDFVCYLDTAEFKAYAALVEMAVHSAPVSDGRNTPGSISTRQIHEILGEHARREWTLDAIDSLLSVEAIGILPTRYRRKLGVKPLFDKIPKSDSMRWIFGRDKFGDIADSHGRTEAVN